MRHSSPSSSNAPQLAYTLISDTASLERSIELWTQDSITDRRIAIDTEFIRERTYAPVLEMVQIASPNGHIGLIDVPAIKDLTALWQFLDDPTLTKLVHAGNQDVEIMALAFGRPLNGPWFDTQVAGAFLGIGLQAGYGAIVQQVLHVKLDKEEGFSDWSRRPFTDSMLNYAAGDVHYLHALETWLSERLAKRGRTQWAIDQTNRILGNSADQVAPEDLWQRVGGKHHLDGTGLAVLRELTIWRDLEAKRRDKPRRNILKDEPLVEIAKRKPRSAGAIGDLRAMPPNSGDRVLNELYQCVQRGVAVPRAECPKLDSTPALDEQGSALLELFAAVVKVRSMDTDLPPSLLAPTEDLRQLAGSRSKPDPRNPLFQGWREELIGTWLRACVEGRLAVSWDAKRGQIRLHLSEPEG